MNAVEIISVSKRFKKTHALDNVTITIPQGYIFGLLGPNGAGKTTLLSILCGLLTRDSGEVRVMGLDIDRNLHAIKQRVNIVFGFTSISVHLTIREYLTYYCYLYGIRNPTECVKEAARAVGVDDRLERIVNELSSGFRQRVMLAKALITQPDILFLDEPTVGLDVDIAIKIRGLIKELKSKGMTIVLTTHNMLEVEELCDTIALISHGKILATGDITMIKKMVQSETIAEITGDHLDILLTKLTGKKFIKNSIMQDDCIHITLTDPSDISKLMEHVAHLNHPIHSIRLLEPTLEEAFLTLTRK